MYWSCLFATLLPGVLIVIFCIIRILIKRNSLSISKLLPGDSRNDACFSNITIGFFHPYCNAGGGGERVLWCAIQALQERYDFVKCIVYTGDTTKKPEDIIKTAKERFNIEFKRHIHFVYLDRRNWVEADHYPFLTLLGQSFGSLVLGFEALFKYSPDVFIDTMGYAFVLPVFKYFGYCNVGSYVHYPTISTDMLEKVNQRQADFNNASYISRSQVLTGLKLFYYHFFSYCYGWCGRCNDVVMVNSSWTFTHIRDLWSIIERTSIVYPPCDTKTLLNIQIDTDECVKKDPRQILSLAQFRPEKNHMLQLRVFEKFHKLVPSQEKSNYKLLLVGGCRNQDDAKRVELLREETKKLDISEYVEFYLNLAHDCLLNLLATSTVGIHTMKDEHFGIGVVEFMAAGLVTLAHNSAGPRIDIVIDWKSQQTGYLAVTEQEYVDALMKIFNMMPSERYMMCLNARDSVKERFSQETFQKEFLSRTEKLLR